MAWYPGVHVGLRGPAAASRAAARQPLRPRASAAPARSRGRSRRSHRRRGGMSNPQSCVLVAEDDARMLRLMQRNLELANYGLAALDAIETKPCDLVLLDIMMPKLDGLEVCRRVREFSSVPIIMVTARNGERDVVLGLDAGADDYLTKPFGAQELLARVRAVLRRSRLTAADTSPGVFEQADLRVEFSQHQVKLRGKLVPLTPTEYRILAQLAQHAGKVLTQEQLLPSVWGPAYKDEAHLLRVNISRLRAKIEDDPSHPRYVLTRPGIGYMMAHD